MNIAAYCRVSTDKSDQLNSLEAQKKFFAEFADKNGHNMVRLYADEGISGTKMKNRKEFLRLMQDAKQGVFEMVVVKDISRFARNTVDFLQSIRTLKELNIETVFLTSNQKVLGNSEFVLTIFAALAQEESANTSKRVKFGKRLNAEKGRVPNIVYGYDKIPGDYFNMTVNEYEADIIHRIYSLYLNEGAGALKIAEKLNEQGVKTKRGNKWTQNAVCRILTNPIYTGKIINGKEEVKDFLSGKRIAKESSEWIVCDRPELRIISDDEFSAVGEILKNRYKAFNITHERQSNKHLFSTLIRCSECGYSFRRSVYRGQVRWVCSGRNEKGTASCSNKTIIREDDLVHDLQVYFADILSDRKRFIDDVASRFKAEYTENDLDAENLDELEKQCRKLEKASQKYKDMYVDDLISREELNEKVGAYNREIAQLQDKMKMLEVNMTKGDKLEDMLEETLKSMEDIVDMSAITNAQLKKIIDKIIVGTDGSIDVYLRIMGDLGLDKDYRVCYDHT